MTTPARMNGSSPDSYYGRPVIKEPVWTWEIPLYFVTGGVAGASANLALAARLAGNRELAQRAQLVGLAGVAVSPALLISDLGRPERFLHMLRVVKLSSPMSVGAWLLTGCGGATSVAAFSALSGKLPRTGLLAGALAALLGLPLTSYTAVLLSDTAVPLWHEARRELPVVFAGSSSAAAGAAAALFTAPEKAGPARRLAVIGTVIEGAATQLMERRLGELAEPMSKGTAGKLALAAKTLATAGALGTGLLGRRHRRLGRVSAAMVVAGEVLERWSVFRAGFESARDPRYTVEPQRRRREAREREAAARA